METGTHYHPGEAEEKNSSLLCFTSFVGMQSAEVPGELRKPMEQKQLTEIVLVMNSTVVPEGLLWKITE